MRKLALLFLLSCPSALFAQGFFVPLQTATKTVNGFLAPAPLATITVCAAGAIGTPCSPALTNTIFFDAALTQPKANPFQADGAGNYQFAVAPGNYTVTVTGTNLPGYSYQISAGGSATISILPGQVGFGSGTNTVTGSQNLTWNTPVLNALNMNMPGASCTGQGANQHGCSLLVFSNSSSVTNTYLNKYSDTSFFITNDDNGSASHGQFGWDTHGSTALLAGGGGPQMQQLNSSLTLSGWTFPVGTTEFSVPGTGQFAIGIPGSAFVAKIWDVTTGCDTWYSASSTANKITACPPAAGSAAVLSAVQCGTVAANGACPNTVTSTAHCVSGIATLSGGSSTVTGISPAFTSSSSWFVVTNDVTTSSNVSKGVPASGTSITFTGTGTDNIAFIGCGG